MGSIKDKYDEVYRDFATPGVSSSGLYEPPKSGIRGIGPVIEAQIALGVLVAGADVVKATRALLDADLAHAADSVGLVYADATDANNDLYIKVDGSGAGTWTLTTMLHNIAAVGMAGADEATEQAAVAVDAAVLARAWASQEAGAVDPVGAPGLLSGRQYAGLAQTAKADAEGARDVAIEKAAEAVEGAAAANAAADRINLGNFDEAVAQVGADRIQTGLDRTATGEDRDAVEAATADVINARDIAITAAGDSNAAKAQAITAAALVAASAIPTIYASVADALSNGVIGNGPITGGAGGANGTFLGTVTGGTGAAFAFVVSGNALTSIIWLAKGRGYTAAPTLVFTASAGLAGAAAAAIIGPNSVDGQSVNVAQANGLAFDTYTNVSGSLAYVSTTLKGGGVALTQKIALLSAPGAVTLLPSGSIVSLDPVMAAITDDRYVPTSMAATVTHNAHPGGTEQYTTSNGAVLTKNYATDSGFAVHRLQMSAHNQLFSLSAAITAGLIKGKFLIKSTPGAGNQNITAGLYQSGFMDPYAVTEGAWTTVSFSRTTAVNNNVNIW